MPLNDYTGNSNNGSGSGNMGITPGGGAMPPTQSQDDSILELLTNLNEEFKNADPARFRDQVIDQTIAVLIGKNKPNPMLTGPAGVGKTRIAEEIARRIANADVSIPARLSDKTIYELPLSNLVAGTTYRGELEERMKMLVEYCEDPKNKVILFIDEIHQISDSKNPTYQQVAQILKPALARGRMSVIGATTNAESRAFDDDPALSRRFSRLIVDELTREQTVEVLEDVNRSLMTHYSHQVGAPRETLELTAIVADEMSSAGSHRPDNAITLLDRTMADAIVSRGRAIREAKDAGNTQLVQVLQSSGPSKITEKRLREVALRMASGHAAPSTTDMQSMIDALGRIKGQDKIISEVTDIIRRTQLAVFPQKTPTTLMFAGASGVGKTEVAKIIAKATTDQAPIILNMTEYSEKMAINRIIGSPAGFIGSDSNQEKPFDSLESNPYRVILLDEIEKAHVEVQRLFLSVFDEGVLRTSQGREVDFSKAIIIATTNAGREAMSGRTIGFGDPQPMNNSMLTSTLTQHFEPEFLGRFSKLIGFDPIDAPTYAQILQESYQRERERIVLERPRTGAQLPAAIDDDTLRELVDTTYVAATGARPAGRAARRYIEDTLISAQNSNQLPAQTAPPAQMDDPVRNEQSDQVTQDVGSELEDVVDQD